MKSIPGELEVLTSLQYKHSVAELSTDRPLYASFAVTLTPESASDWRFAAEILASLKTVPVMSRCMVRSQVVARIENDDER